MKLENYRSLDDTDELMLGDAVKDVEAGEYRLVTYDSFDWLYEGDKIGTLRGYGVYNDVLRLVQPLNNNGR